MHRVSCANSCCINCSAIQLHVLHTGDPQASHGGGLGSRQVTIPDNRFASAGRVSTAAHGQLTEQMLGSHITARYPTVMLHAGAASAVNGGEPGSALKGVPPDSDAEPSGASDTDESVSEEGDEAEVQQPPDSSQSNHDGDGRYHLAFTQFCEPNYGPRDNTLTLAGRVSSAKLQSQAMPVEDERAMQRSMLAAMLGGNSSVGSPAAAEPAGGADADADDEAGSDGDDAAAAMSVAAPEAAVRTPARVQPPQGAAGDEDAPRTVFVRSLPAGTTEALLRSAMSKFGPLKACRCLPRKPADVYAFTHSHFSGVAKVFGWL